MIFADTDVLIDYLAGRDPGASRIARELASAELCTTAITRFELLSGARDPSQESAILQLLDAIPALPLDDAGADRAAAVRRALEAGGNTIGMGDSLIAGIVLSHRGVLLSSNRRHFERVEGLVLGRLED